MSNVSAVLFILHTTCALLSEKCPTIKKFVSVPVVRMSTHVSAAMVKSWSCHDLLVLWFFATPVVYPTSLLPDHLAVLFSLNPMLAVVDGFRWTILGVGSFTTMNSALSALMAITLLVTGTIWFRRRERTFVDSLGSGGI